MTQRKLVEVIGQKTMKNWGIVVLLALVGCSAKEPTAQDFERAAQAYAEKATGPRNFDVWWGKCHADASLRSHDLRKTDSLTTPFVGTAVYDLKLNDVVVVHPDLNDYKAKAVLHETANIEFSWVEGQFVPTKGTVTIDLIDLPEYPETKHTRIRKLSTTKPRSVDETTLQKALIGEINGLSIDTIDEMKRAYKITN